VVKATSILSPNPKPKPVTEAPKQAEVTTTRKTAKIKKLESKPTAAPKPAIKKIKKKKEAAKIVKTVTDKPNPAKLVVPPHPTHSSLKSISKLLYNLPLEAFVELTHRLLTSISSIRTGVARPQAVLKTVILFVAEYENALRKDNARKSPVPRLLECGLRGRKLELEHFLKQHDFNICLLSETFLNTEQAFQLANCLPLQRQTNR
jgi:hypothetical protein